MKKKFLTNLVLLLSLNLLIKPFWILGIDRSVQNIVGAESYGFYYAIFNFSFLFNILLDMGLTNYNNRNIAQNHHLLNKYFSGILVMKIMLSFAYALITILLGYIIGYNGAQMKLLYIMAFNQILISFVLYLRSNITGLHLFKTDSIISVLDRFLMIGFCAVLIWGKIDAIQFSIEWFVYAQTAAYLVTAIVAFFVVVRKAQFSKLYWNRNFIIAVFRQSMPFAILVLLMSFYNRIDSVMIERLLPKGIGAYQSGIYASAYRLLDASNMIAYLFSVILLPIFAKMIKQKENVGEIVKLAFTLLIVPASAIAMSCLAYRQEIMSLLYPIHQLESIAEYTLRINQSAYIFGLLMVCFIAISTTYIFGSLLTANGNLKQLNIVATSGMILNIALNIIMIPHFMAIGSAWASVFTQFLTAGLQMYLAFRIFKFNINVKSIMQFSGFIGINLLNLILIRYFIENWLIGITLFFFLALLLSIVLRIFKFKEVFKIFLGEA